MKSFEDINVLIKVKIFGLKNLFFSKKLLIEKKTYLVRTVMVSLFKKIFFCEKLSWETNFFEKKIGKNFFTSGVKQTWLLKLQVHNSPGT